MRTWELSSMFRAALFAVGLAVAAFCLAAATDEGASLSTRIDRTAVVVPLTTALAVFLALRGSTRGRLELRALAASGASPIRTARGALVGAALPLALVLAWATRSRDLAAAFVPTLEARALIAHGGEFRDPVRGFIISPRTGSIVRMEASALAPPAHAFFPWVAALVVLGSLNLAVRAAIPTRRRAESIVAVTLWLLATMVILHLAGAGRAPLGWAIVPTFLDACVFYLRHLRKDLRQ